MKCFPLRYPPFFDEHPFRIYEKILEGKIEWPKVINSIAKDLIKKLLVRDVTRRLGSLKVCIIICKDKNFEITLDKDNKN